MKKWHIIALLTIASMGVVAALITGIYNYVISPRYIEPLVEQVSEKVRDNEILDKLYEEALVLHEDGVMTDATYTNFIHAYNEYYRDDEMYAKEILQAKAQEDKRMGIDDESSTLKTKYASHKVGVEIIRVNDSEQNGKADVRYSDERTSNRLKAEDYVEAEKILYESQSTEEPTGTPEVIQTAYEKLRKHMQPKEFSSFTRIMSKLDIETLKSYIFDKEGLKAYLHDKLSDDEYKEIVNLGYKYVNVFLEKEE